MKWQERALLKKEQGIAKVVTVILEGVPLGSAVSIPQQTMQVEVVACLFALHSSGHDEMGQDVFAFARLQLFVGKGMKVHGKQCPPKFSGIFTTIINNAKVLSEKTRVSLLSSPALIAENQA